MENDKSRKQIKRRDRGDRQKYRRGIGAINSNLSTMFGDVNEKVGTIAAEVGQTPQGWNAGIFSMIRTLSENVIVPIAGLVIGLSMNFEAVTARYVDVRLERKKEVLDAYHDAVGKADPPKAKEAEPKKAKGKAKKKTLI